MKKIILILSIILTGRILNAQQVPFSENYFLDKFSLSPSYAGNNNPKYLFMGYRSDWSGIEGGPKTVKLSYSDLLKFMPNTGFGGKIVYDKAGIFSQLYILGSYSYNLMINEDNNILFGLSVGLYKNRLNLLDYYNDPGYHLDPALINQDIDSKLKFMTDFSAIWTWKGAEAGLMFSNIMMGDASYKEVDLKYNPLANFQIHATYLINLSEDWNLAPLVILRGGKYIKSQFETATQIMFLKKYWCSLVYRDPGILGFGTGLAIGKGLMLGYNFSYGTNVALGALNNHEINLGINISDMFHQAQ